MLCCVCVCVCVCVLRSGPGPKIVVVQDLDAKRHHVGAFWGEVNRCVCAREREREISQIDNWKRVRVRV